MRALVVFCHPCQDSFNRAVRDVVLTKLAAAGAEVRLSDLYAKGFSPVLTWDEWKGYLNCPDNRTPVAQDVEDVLWCDTLIFIYPTWWYGLPAMLKGWLDRVLLPDVAFLMPDEQNRNIRSNLGHIRRLGVFTTCGATWWLTRVIGAPGRRTLMRGVGFLLARGKRRVFAAHYQMDTSTDASRKQHLTVVAARMDRLIGPVTQLQAPAMKEAAE
jgi:NAD(P)H dehydrogenase (quinone)